MLGTEAFVCLQCVGICETRGQAPMDQLTRGWFTVHVWVHNLTTAVVVHQGPPYCMAIITDSFLSLRSPVNLGPRVPLHIVCDDYLWLSAAF